MSEKLSPGVVTGEEYLKLVNACKDGGYALPAVNIVSTNALNAALEAAMKNRSDIVIQLSNGGAEFYAGKGTPDSLKAKIHGAVSAARHVHEVAKLYGVCVVMHTDHANRKLIPWVEGMIDEGEKFYNETGKPLFSSHMLDLSEETLDFNLSESARILERVTKMGMSIEIELGVTGGEEDGIGSEDNIDNPNLYTQPEEVLEAYERLASIGHFTVAASFGNVHGVYKPGNVKLRPEILKNSQKLVSEKHGTSHNPLDLVFHGGSGSEKEKIEEALGYGVFKMNIDTDTQFAFAEPIGKYVKAHEKAFMYQIDPETEEPYKKLYDPRKWLRECELGMSARLDEAYKDLGSSGKSISNAI